MKIGIVGCGNMGSAFGEKLALKHEIFLYDRDLMRAESLAKKLKGKSLSSSVELVQSVEVIVLAIKPKDLESFSDEVDLKKGQTLISMMSGTPIASLRRAFGDEGMIIRIMPNICVQRGLGVIGLVEDPSIDFKAKQGAESLLKPLGSLFWMSEPMLDNLTPLSGCGPAFVYFLVEAFIDAGIALGFRYEEAYKISLQTIQGAVELLMGSEKGPTELKYQVTSPGGDTIKGLLEMERLGLKAALIDGILAAYPQH